MPYNFYGFMIIFERWMLNDAYDWHCNAKFAELANIFDMKNVGVATPTLQEWCEAVAWCSCDQIKISSIIWSYGYASWW